MIKLDNTCVRLCFDCCCRGCSTLSMPGNGSGAISAGALCLNVVMMLTTYEQYDMLSIHLVELPTRLVIGSPPSSSSRSTCLSGPRMCSPSRPPRRKAGPAAYEMVVVTMQAPQVTHTSCMVSLATATVCNTALRMLCGTACTSASASSILAMRLNSSTVVPCTGHQCARNATTSRLHAPAPTPSAAARFCCSTAGAPLQAPRSRPCAC